MSGHAADTRRDAVSNAVTTWPVEHSFSAKEAGEHLAICFLPDPATGAPHFALGMIMPLTVG